MDTDYPEYDCVFLNAKIHARHDFSGPKILSLNESNEETRVNFSKFVALMQAFVPRLMSKESLSSTWYVDHLPNTSKDCLTYAYSSGSNLAVVQ